jgi:hypothetical protein
MQIITLGFKWDFAHSPLSHMVTNISFRNSAKLFPKDVRPLRKGAASVPLHHAK